MNEDIQALEQQASAGDRRAFGRLYDLYIEEIYRFVYYKTLHAPTAEDLTSQAFTKALKKITSFQPGKGGFRAWMYTIARNIVTDHYRMTKPADNIDDVYDLAAPGKVEEQTDMALALAEAQEALGKLEMRQREIILLRVWEQKSYAEIAEILSKSESACKMQYARAVQKLRSLLPLSTYLVLLLSL